MKVEPKDFKRSKKGMRVALRPRANHRVRAEEHDPFLWARTAYAEIVKGVPAKKQ